LVSFAVLEDDGGKRVVDRLNRELSLCLAGNRLDKNSGTWELPHFLGFHHQDDLTVQLREELHAYAAQFQKIQKR